MADEPNFQARSVRAKKGQSEAILHAGFMRRDRFQFLTFNPNLQVSKNLSISLLFISRIHELHCTRTVRAQDMVSIHIEEMFGE